MKYYIEFDIVYAGQGGEDPYALVTDDTDKIEKFRCEFLKSRNFFRERHHDVYYEKVYVITGGNTGVCVADNTYPARHFTRLKKIQWTKKGEETPINIENKQEDYVYQPFDQECCLLARYNILFSLS